MIFNFKKKNYLSNLIHYLNEFKEIFNDSELTLKDITEYYDKTCNHNSVTDSSTFLHMKRLTERFSYISKYIDVILDFYKLLEDKE